MAPSKDVLLTHMAWVETDSGRQLVKKGEELPADVLGDEVTYLRGLNALGAPPAEAVDGEPADEVTALSGAMTEEAIVDYVRDATIKEIVAAVGGDSDLATKVLNAERDATGDESREGLVKALTPIAEGSQETPAADSGNEPAAGGETPAEPVDYSGWKGPQIKEELTKRGIEFKPVGVKNTDLVALLEADDKKSA